MFSACPTHTVGTCVRHKCTRACLVEGSLGKIVVLDLSKQLEWKKHHIYFDSFSSQYLSLPLCVTWVAMPVGWQGKIIETSLRQCV